ncbi:MAG: nucleoside deaminase [Spirochaetales bacterium]|nr:nucleoside deaminase [Spirochaetales bacterium]
MQIQLYYDRLLALAHAAGRAGEVPVAALLLRPAADGFDLVAEAANSIVCRRDPTAHAEMRVIRMAARRIGSERLPGTLLLSTLEPCLMCTGAIVLARIAAVHFFARTGTGIGITEILTADTLPRLNHRPAWLQIEEYSTQAQETLQSFFADRRGK